MEIHAEGKVSPTGFIDLHTHSPFPIEESFQVRDGATTILDTEAGACPASSYGHFIKDSACANFGGSTAHSMIRIQVIEGKNANYAIDEKGHGQIRNFV